MGLVYINGIAFVMGDLNTMLPNPEYIPQTNMYALDATQSLVPTLQRHRCPSVYAMIMYLLQC